MIKQLGKAALGAAGFRYVTALTDPQIRRLLAAKVLDPELFDEEPLAIEHEGRRLILRCNSRDRRSGSGSVASISSADRAAARPPECAAGAETAGKSRDVA